jgi:dTDP-4-dehydrorhamnose reductase
MTTPMNVLLTGGAGLLGQHLITLAPDNVTLTVTQRSTPAPHPNAVTVDLTDGDAVNALFLQCRPALVLHTAYSMHRQADIVTTTQNIVAACLAQGAQLIHMSSDALFDGRHAPYHESDAPSPITDYGRWKAEAEAIVQTHLPNAAIVRTSLITDFAPLDPRSAWIANALRHKEPITLFVDELRCPIRPADLAAQLWEIAHLPTAAQSGVWHLVGVEVLSRYALGLLIAAHEGLDPAGITAAYTDPAVRPRDLRLSTRRADQTLVTRPRPISTMLVDGLKSRR